MKKFIITAGGTSERIDNVRKITNSSSGKLGCTIANTILEEIDNVKIYYVCSKSMAVSDYTTDFVTTLDRLKKSFENTGNFNLVEKINGSKISSNEDNLVIVLKQTPKVISIIKDVSPSTFLVGFKLLDGVSRNELISVGRKLMDKNSCDMVVANDLSDIRNGNHIAYLIDKDENVSTANGKDDIAKKLVRRFKYER